MYQPLSIEKEMHNPKSSIKFYLGNLLRTMDRETASSIILRNYSEEEREEPGYIRIFFFFFVFYPFKGTFFFNQKKKNVVKCQIITAHQKEQIFQINGFSIYLSMCGKMQKLRINKVIYI